MTDEEKDRTEKEYKEWLRNDHKLLAHPTYCDIEQKCFRAFFAGTRYGLAEGKKEKEELIGLFINVDLEKENAELKEKVKGFENGDVAWQGDMDATVKQNLDLKEQIEELQLNLRSRNDLVEELTMQIEKMKKSCLDVMQVQGNNLTDDYMAGMYNGMVVVYNSCFLKGDELEKNYCSKSEHNKWEMAE